jgi:ABC-type transport system involved in multi-copper enzyme maturation permease subunit
MKINPVLRKELQISARSIKIPIALMIFNGLMALIALLVIAITNAVSVYDYDYTSLHAIFPFAVSAEFGLISLFIAVMTSSSISSEREKQTLDVMLTTPVKPFSIVVGKVAAVVVKVLMFVISSLPILSISFLLGGLNWLALPGLVVVMVYLCIYVGSIGVFCSSLVKKSAVAALLTIVIGLVISVGTLVVLFIAGLVIEVSNGYTNINLGGWPLILLFNPYAVLVDFELWVMNAASIADAFADGNVVSAAVLWVMRFLIPLGMILNLGIAFFFLKMAARVISPRM